MMAARLLSSHPSLINGFRLLYSVIPVAGTVVGGLIGVGAGMIGSWAARSALDGSGFTNWAKEGLGGALNNFNEPLGEAWDWTSEKTAAISDGASKAWNATADGVSNAASTVAGGVSDAANSVAGGLSKAWSWVGG
jgi:phage-related protein